MTRDCHFTIATVAVEQYGYKPIGRWVIIVSLDAAVASYGFCHWYGIFNCWRYGAGWLIIGRATIVIHWYNHTGPTFHGK